MKRPAFALLASLTCVSACTIAPTAPSVMALPGTGKTFDQFRTDDGSCRQFASEQVGGVSANQAATTSVIGSAAVGTALGAAAARRSTAAVAQPWARVPACLRVAYSAPALRGPPRMRCSAATTPHTCNACTWPAIAFRSPAVS
jgi:hypothetical protein